MSEFRRASPKCAIRMKRLPMMRPAEMALAIQMTAKKRGRMCLLLPEPSRLPNQARFDSIGSAILESSSKGQSQAFSFLQVGHCLWGSLTEQSKACTTFHLVDWWCRGSTKTLPNESASSCDRIGDKSSFFFQFKCNLINFKAIYCRFLLLSTLTTTK